MDPDDIDDMHRLKEVKRYLKLDVPTMLKKLAELDSDDFSLVKNELLYRFKRLPNIHLAISLRCSSDEPEGLLELAISQGIPLEDEQVAALIEANPTLNPYRYL